MGQPASSFCDPGVFRWPVRIYWEDTDAGGIVYHANYLKFFERARTEWWRGFGPDQEALRSRGLGVFVVSEASVKYLRSARLDDLLLTTVQLREVGRASLVLQQQAWRGDDLLAEGHVRIGWVKADALGALRPARLPPEVLERLPPVP